MTCPATKRIANKARPLFAERDESCSYVIVESSKRAAAEAVADAGRQVGYLRRSRFFKIGNDVRVYVYFEHT